MSAAGLAVEYLFTLLDPHPCPATFSALGGSLERHDLAEHRSPLLLFGGLYWLYRNRIAWRESKYAKDPVCGMQVELAHAPAQRSHDHAVSYFCSDRCVDRFDSDPSRYSTDPTADSEGASMDQHQAAAQTLIDPICGMTVDIATADYTASHDGQQYYFCGAGCLKAFTRNPDAFLPVGSAQS